VRQAQSRSNKITARGRRAIDVFRLAAVQVCDLAPFTSFRAGPVPVSLVVSPAWLRLRCARWLPRSLRGIFASMSNHSLTRDEAIRRLQAIEAEIRHLGVRRLALFGSVLRNEAHPNSDVDVLVEFSPDQKSFDRFMALADLLEEVLERRVEIVTTEALSPYIGPHILAEARDVLRAA
jgi:uncharacterized protein